MEILEKIAEKVNGKVWIKNGKQRIYFKTDKSASAYLDYEVMPKSDNGAEALNNSSLKVFSDCQSQSVDWNVNRAKQIKFEIIRKLNALLELNLDLPKKWQEVIL